MIRRLQLSAVLLAWLLATGSQWDGAQVFAWGKMVATYSRTMPLLDAVRLTFTPGNECEICTAVGAAKQQQQDGPAAPAAKWPAKVLLVFQPAPVIVVAVPDVFAWSRCDRLTALGASRASPPVPPPRAA